MQPQMPYGQPPVAPPPGQVPQPQPNAGLPGNLPPGYEFITSPTPPKPAPGPQSTTMRAVMVLGGLLVLIVVFAIFKSIISGGSNKTQLVSVLQDQQAIIHLATNAGVQQNLSTTNKYFSNTAQLSITSDQSRLISYMAKSKMKINAKEMNLKVSASTDKELTDAAAASTYDATYKTIMESKLKAYQTDLKIAYAKTTGPEFACNDATGNLKVGASTESPGQRVCKDAKGNEVYTGKGLLSQQYDNATLLLQQLQTEVR